MRKLISDNSGMTPEFVPYIYICIHVCVHARMRAHTPERERLFSFCVEVFLSVRGIRTLDLPQADFTSPRAPLRSVYPEDGTEHAQEQGQLQKDQDLEVDAAQQGPGEGAGLSLSMVGSALAG